MCRGIGWTRSLEVRRCILYIVKRTQLYLDEDLWIVLHLKSRQENTTISELVRQAVRERYLNQAEERTAAMLGIVAMWKDRADIQDSTAYIRELRKDRRSEPLRRK